MADHLDAMRQARDAANAQLDEILAQRRPAPPPPPLTISPELIEALNVVSAATGKNFTHLLYRLENDANNFILGDLRNREIARGKQQLRDVLLEALAQMRAGIPCAEIALNLLDNI